jgi:hypothetical protein
MNHEIITGLFIPHALSAKTSFIRGQKGFYSENMPVAADTYPSAVLLLFACQNAAVV